MSIWKMTAGVPTKIKGEVLLEKKVLRGTEYFYPVIFNTMTPNFQAVILVSCYSGRSLDGNIWIKNESIGEEGEWE